MSGEFEALLLAQRAALLERSAENERELAGIRSARSDGTADDEHDPEGSTLTEDWSRVVGLGEAARAGLRETDAALARMADGSYGRCLHCGQAIAPARLRVRPAAEFCIACAR